MTDESKRREQQDRNTSPSNSTSGVDPIPGDPLALKMRTALFNVARSQHNILFAFLTQQKTERYRHSFQAAVLK